MITIVDIIRSIKEWVLLNFDNIEIDCIEVNPIIFGDVSNIIKKEQFADSNFGDMQIIAIDDVRIKRSNDPMAGIHIKFIEKKGRKDQLMESVINEEIV